MEVSTWVDTKNIPKCDIFILGKSVVFGIPNLKKHHFLGMNNLISMKIIPLILVQ